MSNPQHSVAVTLSRISVDRY